MSTTAVPYSAAPNFSATGGCRELVQAVLDAGNEADATARIRSAAVRLVHNGVPLAAVRRELREGMKASVRQHASRRGSDTRRACPAPSIDAALDAFALAAEVVSQAYAQPLPRDAASDALAAALLSGSNTISARARECGMTVADSYSVIAVAAPGRGPRSRTALAAMSRRVRAESIERCGAEILMRLSNDGGTILVPDSEVTDVDVRVLWCSIAQRSLIAATVPATSSEIPVAAGQAHELLDLALALGRTSGLYRFDDLALEYQLTRPGLGRERLAAVLDPLVPHPHLWQTLELFLISNLSRRALARRLGLHTNTIEYRLKRVAALTGLDPLTPTGQWHLRSALVARIRVNRHNR